MKTITVAELRQNPTAALDDVEDGETYEVTRHRRVIARLVPVEPEELVLIPPRNPNGPRLSEVPFPKKRTYEEIEALRREMESEW